MLRSARVEDAEWIADYHHRCWLNSFAQLVDPAVMDGLAPRAERWTAMLSGEDGFSTAVATDANGRPLAHAAVRGNELVQLFVDPEAHGRGLGRLLLQWAEEQIRGAGHVEAELHTIVGNTPALGLYQANGWQLTEETIVERLPNGSSFTEHVLRKTM